jgi:hypothetical protein
MEEERPTQFTQREQARILRELEQHLKDAREQGDVARTFYTQEAIRAADHG